MVMLAVEITGQYLMVFKKVPYYSDL
jgi:hypothetical protein